MTSSLALALKVHTCLAMPSMFSGREEPSRNSDKEEEEMDTTEDDVEEKGD